MTVVSDAFRKQFAKRLSAIDHGLSALVRVVRAECDGDSRFIDDVADLACRVRQTFESRYSQITWSDDLPHDKLRDTDV
jgi:hypothetical protein